MAKLLFVTSQEKAVNEKPRVYFTAHPEDFDTYFASIRKAIFHTHHCTIFYTESMTEPVDARQQEEDLQRMNLFVVPVTRRLLESPNRAMQEDLAYAKREHIPILPIVMEPGLDGLYGRAENFGPRQYLVYDSQDDTAIRFESKLKNYLDSVLISDEMAQRIRAAFDAYIFLSYRKKDRSYANELMRLIHREPAYRDVAIWYDEFLTPGESFRANIEKAMEKSQLFALLVTPNVLEMVEGKPNFVMGEEYPAALQANKLIVPAEMEKTDPQLLQENFRDLPPCVDPKDQDAFHQRLLDAIQRVAITANDHDAEHNFLIGLAYLEGIDVEQNRQRGIEMITTAAENGLPEAMRKLYDWYTNVSFDFPKAQFWAQERMNWMVKNRGYQDPETLDAMFEAAGANELCGKPGVRTVLYVKTYYFREKLLGKEHPATLQALHEVAKCTEWDQTKKCQRFQEVVDLRSRVLGQDHPDTIHSMSRLADCYLELGDHAQALPLYLQVARHYWKIEKWISTSLLKSVVECYEKLDQPEKAAKWQELKEQMSKVRSPEIDNVGQLEAMLNYWLEASDEDGFLDDFRGYGSVERVVADAVQMLQEAEDPLTELEVCIFLFSWFLGEEYDVTYQIYEIAAEAYEGVGRDVQAFPLREKLYEKALRELGENHDDTIAALEIVCKLRRSVWGNVHPKLLSELQTLARAYMARNDMENYIRCRETRLDVLIGQVGTVDAKLRLDMALLAGAYQKNGQHAQAIAMLERLLDMNIRLYGPENGIVVSSMIMLGNACYTAGQRERAKQVLTDAYDLALRVLGPDHKDTQQLAQALPQL